MVEIGMRVAKWGGSLAVRLPKRLVDEMRLAAGDELAIVEASKAALLVDKVDRRRDFLARMESFRWAAPEDYRFDRDEANRR
jgi:antitoxin MazE